MVKNPKKLSEESCLRFCNPQSSMLTQAKLDRILRANDSISKKSQNRRPDPNHRTFLSKSRKVEKVAARERWGKALDLPWECHVIAKYSFCFEEISGLRTLISRPNELDMEQKTFMIELDGISSSDASRYAGELKDILLDASNDISVEVRRSDETAQDFGSTIVLILGAPAVIVAARALGDYLKLRRSATIRIKNSSGEVIGTGLTSQDAKAIVQILQNAK